MAGYFKYVTNDFFQTEEYTNAQAWERFVSDIETIGTLGVYRDGELYYKDFLVNNGEDTGYMKFRMNVVPDEGGYRVSTRGLAAEMGLKDYVRNVVVAMGYEATEEGIDALYERAQALTAANVDATKMIYTIIYNDVSDVSQAIFDEYPVKELYNIIDEMYNPRLSPYSGIPNEFPEGMMVYDGNTKGFPEAIASQIDSGAFASGYLDGSEFMDRINLMKEENDDVRDVLTNYPILSIHIGFYVAPGIWTEHYYGYKTNSPIVVSSTAQGQSYLIQPVEGKHVSVLHTPDSYQVTTEAYTPASLVMYNYPHGVPYSGYPATAYDSVGWAGNVKPVVVKQGSTPTDTWSPGNGYRYIKPYYDPDEEIEQPEAQDPDMPDPEIRTIIIYLRRIEGREPIEEDDDPDDEGTNTDPVQSNMGMCNVYSLTASDMKDLNAFMWKHTTMDELTQVFRNNPMDAIVSLHQLFISSETFEYDDDATIYLGYTAAERPDGTDFAVPTITKRFQRVLSGEIEFPRIFDDVRDFQIKCSIYLPFIGIRELDIKEMLGRLIGITYWEDVYTGDMICEISTHTKQSPVDKPKVLYTFNGNCSAVIPLTGADKSRMISNVVSTGTSAVSTVASFLTGNLWGGVNAAIGTVGNATEQHLQPNVSITKSGNMTGNAGAMGYKKPYLILEKPIPYDAMDRKKFTGLPVNETVQLGTLSGYTVVNSTHVDTIGNITSEERNEIENILKSGIIL